MVAAAAELALSCLAHAQALNPQETKRALLQCKEQSNNMLEKVRLNSAFLSKDYTALPQCIKATVSTSPKLSDMWYGDFIYMYCLFMIMA